MILNVSYVVLKTVSSHLFKFVLKIIRNLYSVSILNLHACASANHAAAMFNFTKIYTCQKTFKMEDSIYSGTKLSTKDSCYVFTLSS